MSQNGEEKKTVTPQILPMSLQRQLAYTYFYFILKKKKKKKQEQTSFQLASGTAELRG